jgi:hypothetical protein
LDDKSAFPALPEGPKTETKPVSTETKAKAKAETKPKPETKAKAETKAETKTTESSKPQTAMDKLDSTFSPITGTWADQFDDE